MSCFFFLRYKHCLANQQPKFRPCSTKGLPRCKYQIKIFISFAITFNSFGTVQQLSEIIALKIHLSNDIPVVPKTCFFKPMLSVQLLCGFIVGVVIDIDQLTSIVRLDFFN